VIFGNVAIRRPPFVFIDEPETNLHPALQIAFLTSLARYAKGNVLFATHSIGLARATAENIYSFQRGTKGIPVVRRFERTPNYAEFAGEMSFSAFQELGCDAILLVEGVTDIKTCQQFLRILKKDARVVVIHLGGDEMVRGGVDQELHELTRITTRVFALVDSEREGFASHLLRSERSSGCHVRRWALRYISLDAELLRTTSLTRPLSKSAEGTTTP
jgi:energy-coupling factor transporter ATP-binding protein EcfA2